MLHAESDMKIDFLQFVFETGKGKSKIMTIANPMSF